MTRGRALSVICGLLWLAALAPAGAKSRWAVFAYRVGCPGGLSAGDYVQQVPGWSNRDYLLHVPATYDCLTPLPVVVALHGGGSRKEGMRALTCPDADPNHPACLDRLADREGFLVVYPDGTENFFWRTFDATGRWNAEVDSTRFGYACVSGHACATGADDLRYFGDLLDHLATVVNVDPRRVFVTGISNGAAMAHRLACEMSDRIAAIAPVAGGNQFSVFHECAPARAVPVIAFHGTADPAWGYGTERDDLNLNGQGLVISAPRTVSDWAARNGCDPEPVVIPQLADIDTTDGSTVTPILYPGCADGAEVILYRINGGGHMWLDGRQWDVFFGRYGPTNRDLNGNAVMWEFFKAHPLPD